MRVVNILGLVGFVLVASLAYAPYAQQKPDISILTALSTLAGTTLGYLAGLIQQSPRPNAGQRATDTVQPVKIDQPANEPVPVEEVKADSE